MRTVDNTGIQCAGAAVSGAGLHGLPPAGAGRRRCPGSGTGDLSGTWRAIDRCPPGYEKQWLARIASNKAKDYLRSAWVRRVNTPGDDILALEGAPPGSDPEQQVLDAMSEETLTGKILGMREPYRTPCRLMLLEGRTAAEAAALCGRPQKTVEAQIYRAKKMLAEQIRQERRSEDGIVS